MNPKGRPSKDRISELGGNNKIKGFSGKW